MKNAISELRDLIMKDLAGKLDTEQILVITEAICCGIDSDLIELCIDNELSSAQMVMIFDSIFKGIDKDIISLYTKKEIDTDIMEIIRNAIINYNLSYEQVELICKYKFNRFQILEIVAGFINNLSYENVTYYAIPSYDNNQMKIIRLGFEAGLDIEKIKFYSDPSFDHYKMHSFYDAFYKLGISIDKLKMIYNDNMNIYKFMEIVKYTVRDNLSDEQIKFLCNDNFDLSLVHSINYAFKNYEEEYINLLLAEKDLRKVRYMCSSNGYFEWKEYISNKLSDHSCKLIEQEVSKFRLIYNLSGIAFKYDIKHGILDIRFKTKDKELIYLNLLNELNSLCENIKTLVPEVKEVKTNLFNQIKVKKEKTPGLYDESYKRGIDEFSIIDGALFYPKQYSDYVKYNEQMCHSSTKDIIDTCVESDIEFAVCSFSEAVAYEDECDILKALKEFNY